MHFTVFSAPERPSFKGIMQKYYICGKQHKRMKFSFRPIRFPVSFKRRMILWSIMAAGWVFPVSAQWIGPGNDDDFTKKFKPWGISLSANWYPEKTAPLFQTGSITERTYLAWGYSAGLAYLWNWNNKTGIKLELKAEKMPLFTYRFSLPASETIDGKEFSGVAKAYAPFTFHLPVTVEYRSFIIPQYVFYLRAGVDISYRGSLTRTYAANEYFSVSYIQPRGWNFGPVISAGWYYPFERVLWETSFIYRPAYKNYYSGTYIWEPASSAAETGTITRNGAYVGLEFTWYFRRAFIGDDAQCARKVHSKEVLKRKKKQLKAKRRAEKILEKAQKKEKKRAKSLEKRRKKRRSRIRKSNKKFIIF